MTSYYPCKNNHYQIGTALLFLLAGATLFLQGTNIFVNYGETALQVSVAKTPHHIAWDHARELRSALAGHALLQVEQRGDFNTKLTSPEFVFKHGFPKKWSSCALERPFYHNGNVNYTKDIFEILVLGGSTSARPGDNCTPAWPWPAFLEYKLNAELPFNGTRFVVKNYGQGASFTALNALYLDELINVSTTDLIVWDFAVNDDEMHGGGPLELSRKLDFWLTRINAIYTRQRKAPPPVMLNMLWGGNIRQLTDKLHDNYTSRIFPLLQSYLAMGWDIAVNHVGGAIENVTTVKSNPTLLVDDNSHPGCASCHFIADMMKVAIYANYVEECTLDMMESNNSFFNMTKNRIPPHTNIHGKMDPSWYDLWTDLFLDHVVIGSLTPWEPKIPNTTNLKLGNAADAYTLPTERLGRKDPNRKDRKNAYVIPKCSSVVPPFTIVLLEPNLKWLALSLTKQVNFANVTINGIRLQQPVRPTPWIFAAFTENFINRQWYQILDQVQKADTYELSICDDSNSHLPMHNYFVIGVMVPNATALLH